MTDAQIRAEIIARLKDGRLPKRLPGELPLQPGVPGNLGSIAEGGDKCSACDGDNPDFTYTGSSGNQKISFHNRCKEIWNEERVKI